MFFKLFSSRPILHSQIFSRPLKKGPDSAIFPPASRCSLKKKKRSSPRIDLSFRYFFPKIKVFSKPAVPKLCAAKVCESCCTYCFSHNNCSVKVISSNFPSENDSDWGPFSNSLILGGKYRKIRKSDINRSEDLFFFLEDTLIFGEKRLFKEVMELNTFFHYGPASIFKSSKGAVKKKVWEPLL